MRERRRRRRRRRRLRPSSPPPLLLPPLAAKVLTGFFRPARVAWHPPLALPQRGGKKTTTTASNKRTAAHAAAAETSTPPLLLPLFRPPRLRPRFLFPPDLLFLLPPGWHPPLVLLDRRLLTPAALGIPKKHKRGGVGRWHAPLAWPPRVAAAAAARAAAEFNGKRVRIARYAPVAASAKCGRCKYCLFPEMRQACTLRRAEAERRRAEEEVAALEREADAAEAEAAAARKEAKGGWRALNFFFSQNVN